MKTRPLGITLPYLLPRRVRAAFQAPNGGGPGERESRCADLALRAFDGLLPLGGLVLLAMGMTVWPPALGLGSLALALAFVAWVAEADGLALPRPGRASILTCGCGDAPLAFTVRDRGAVLLFSREDSSDSPAGGHYTVRERWDGVRPDPRWEMPRPGPDWTVRGRVPVASLRFERHERVSYVRRGSLRRALASPAPVSGA